MNIRSLIVILSALVFSSVSFAKNWNVSSRYETRKNSDIKQSVIQFTKDSENVVYRPSEPPLGSVEMQKVVFKDKPVLFVTTWAAGSRNVLFRVFSPDTHGATPICEVSSFGETTQLQIKEGQLQLSVYTEGSEKATWENCGESYDSERKPDSKAKNKN